MNDAELDPDATLDADMAFINSQTRGETKAESVRAAIRAYLESVAEPKVMPGEW